MRKVATDFLVVENSVCLTTLCILVNIIPTKVQRIDQDIGNAPSGRIDLHSIGTYNSTTRLTDRLILIDIQGSVRRHITNYANTAFESSPATPALDPRPARLPNYPTPNLPGRVAFALQPAHWVSPRAATRVGNPLRAGHRTPTIRSLNIFVGSQVTTSFRT